MSQAGWPAYQPFFLRLTPISHRKEPTIPEIRDAGGNWQPPSRTDLFDFEEADGWWIWDPDADEYSSDSGFRWLRRPNDEENARREPHRAGTMFWDPEVHHYWHIDVNCQTGNIEDNGSVWKRPSFGICTDEGQGHIAVIGHYEGRRRLHMPGPNNWFEGLLPITCQITPGVPTCGLAGELDILVGLIALSTDTDYAHYAVDQAFRSNKWTTQFVGHNCPASNSVHIQHGMIIEIAFDNKRTNRDILKAWERGAHGPIFS